MDYKLNDTMVLLSDNDLSQPYLGTVCFIKSNGYPILKINKQFSSDYNFSYDQICTEFGNLKIENGDEYVYRELYDTNEMGEFDTFHYINEMTTMELDDNTYIGDICYIAHNGDYVIELKDIAECTIGDYIYDFEHISQLFPELKIKNKTNNKYVLVKSEFN